jgi:hypothetical protein
MAKKNTPAPKALTVDERAVIAIGYDTKAATELTTLAQKNAHITEITNDDGRKQADRARLDLRAARLEVQRRGKAAREDATAYSRAVIAEEGRLVALVEPEEDRLAKLVEDYDAAIEAEKERAVLAEQQRVEGIQRRIQAIRDEVSACAGLRSHLIAIRRNALADQTIDYTFGEFEQQARDARDATIARLEELRDAALEREEREEQARKDQEELAKLRAEKAARDKADAEKREKEEREEAARREEIARVERIRAERERQAKENDAQPQTTNETTVSRIPASLGPGICDGHNMPRDACPCVDNAKPPAPEPIDIPAPQFCGYGATGAGAPPPVRPPPIRPTLEEIARVVADHWEVDEGTALNWLDRAVRGTSRAA